MKLLIASDLHGSAYWTGRLCDAMVREGAGRLLLLGDILYHGPRNALPREYDPKRVAEMLNQIKDRILCVRGNCDSEVDEMMLDFPITAAYAMLFSGERAIYATHGHHMSDGGMPAFCRGDILLYGHTHVPDITTDEDTGVTMINPGSVSIPKGGSDNGYMTFDGSAFEWKSMAGEKYKSFLLY